MLDLQWLNCEMTVKWSEIFHVISGLLQGHFTAGEMRSGFFRHRLQVWHGLGVSKGNFGVTGGWMGIG